MEKIIFGIVLLHLVVGLGWAIYKIEFQKNKPNKNENR
jgi:hypothetical protein